MTGETIDAIARRILASPLAADPVSVVWHGGEPTALPPAWYEEAFSRIAAAVALSPAPERTIRHCFQTNAVAIDERWIALLRRWDVQVGVSLDGPADLNDRHRRTRNGRGSFALTMRGIECLQANGYPFHVIAVLTATSILEPDRLYDFFAGNSLRDVCFNIEEEEGTHRTSSIRGPDFEAAYGRFLARFASRMARDPTPMVCREVDCVRWLAGASPYERRHNPQVTPLNIVSVAADGSMSTYSPEFLGMESPEFGGFMFGNVREDGPEAILRHPAFRRLREQIDAGVEACRGSCAWFDVCGGGAPANKFFELGSCSGTETMYCRLTRQVGVEVVLGVLEKELLLI